MKTATFASAATLLAASNAASVTLQTTKCLDSSIPYGEQFSITLNTAQPIAKDLPSVCGLRIISASDAVDVRSIQCQAFRDVTGTQPGSAVFTYDAPALIATNPVQEKAIKCTITPSTYNTVEKRQATNSTISSAPSSQTQSGGSSSSGLVLSGLPTITSSLRVITSTATVGPSSGLPSSSANGTTPSVTMRPTPSTASSASPSSTGAAGQVGVGVGVAVGAVLAMFV